MWKYGKDCFLIAARVTFLVLCHRRMWLFLALHVALLFQSSTAVLISVTRYNSIELNFSCRYVSIIVLGHSVASRCRGTWVVLPKSHHIAVWKHKVICIFMPLFDHSNGFASIAITCESSMSTTYTPSRTCPTFSPLSRNYRPEYHR